ncbi:DUF4271 domain-containing protein [Spirosoma rhododendri]|uniref:DUF4271 domain-containing protein n=1 Tax=Spirosoma rhododendri TaxID=2728024 RepID=UPI0020C20B78|nr:DUF4271 domain-containing protein [Spirosoma rhododendri]
MLFALFFHSLIHSFTHSAFAQPRSEGIGPNGQYYPVHSFQDDFQVFDAATQAYVPYIPELHATQTALSAYVDLESNRHYKLLLTTQEDGYLFINAALRRNLRAGTWQVLDIDSLFRVYRRPEIFLTLYGSPGVAGKQLYIAYPRSAAQKTIVLRDDNLSVRPRPIPIYSNFLSLGLLIVLAFFAFLFSFHNRAFSRFFSLRDLLSVRAQEESFLISRPLSSVNLLFTLGLSLLVAYLMMLVQSHNVDVFSGRVLLPMLTQWGGIGTEYVLLTGLSFAVLIGKYLLVEIVSGLYKLQDISNVHFFKILQSSLLFFTGLALAMLIVSYNIDLNSWSENAVLFPLIGFYTVRIALLYAVVRAGEPIKNLYLFSYLCIVELIPLIIGLRLIL